MIGAFNIALKTVGNTSYPRHDDEKLVTDYLIDSGDNNPLIAQFDVMPFRYMVFKFDSSVMKRTKIKSLNDKSLFLGISSLLLPVINDEDEDENCASSRLPFIITWDIYYFNIDGVIIYSHEHQLNFMIGVSHRDSDKF